MTAYEMMLSESQERMLMVLRPEQEPEAEAIFRKWGLDFAVVGKTTDDLRFRVMHKGRVEADLPIKDLGDQAPEYDRPHVHKGPPLPLVGDFTSRDIGEDLLRILASPDMSSRRWVWEQYDTFIRGDTLERPGGDAGVVRITPTKALAFAADVTPRYCAADAFEGAKQAVAECWRNLTAVGAEPLAITDNLNFGNPEKPEIMGELVDGIRGIGEACRALAFPVVSGNVSLYNETNGAAIPPTPTIGGVGLIDDLTRVATIAFKAEGEAICLIGAPPSWGQHLGQSIWLREVQGEETGFPPPVDLAHEKRVGDFVRGAVRSGMATGAHDLSDGGLAVALAEMAMASGIGATVDSPPDMRELVAAFFGEDQARYIVTAATKDAESLVAQAAAAGISAIRIGETAGTELKLGPARGISVASLGKAHESWFPSFMAGYQNGGGS
jgi:phosphoribosylformylglycinamidine synthase